MLLISILSALRDDVGHGAGQFFAVGQVDVFVWAVGI